MKNGSERCPDHRGYPLDEKNSVGKGQNRDRLETCKYKSLWKKETRTFSEWKWSGKRAGPLVRRKRKVIEWQTVGSFCSFKGGGIVEKKRGGTRDPKWAYKSSL